jgi:two-component system NarL family sensor kinase
MLVWLEQRQNAEIEPVSPSEAQLRRHAYALLSTQEVERGRVASELHDGVAPLIVMAKFMIEDALGRLGRDAAQEAAELMRGTVTRLREALAEVQRISTELRPNSLDDLGLLPTIEWHCRIVSQTYESLQVTTDLAVEEAAIPETLKLEIFRIVQESVNNVVRHARASEARVALRSVEGRLELHIEDNGIGFEVEPVLRGESGVVGLGLHNMRKRVDATQGSLRIDSSQWHGTRIDASWPLARAG